MTLDKAREFIQTQVSFKSGYNRNATRLILAEVQKVHGQEAVNQLINEFELENKFGLVINTKFK
ncbi:MAG: hypothetical protein HN826_05805 [Methylococcales bacterium]|jgi:hypothetical protein|nr:hypothetical protein [Methylococcales bacterium]